MVNNDYLLGFYFKLSFKGKDTAFKEVSGLSKELGFEEVGCGGENRFKYRLPIPPSNKNLVLKRALISKKSPLMEWCVDSISGGLVNPIKVRDVSVSLLGNNGKAAVVWYFFKAYPVKYSVSDLKSQDNELVMEYIELAYTYSKALRL